MALRLRPLRDDELPAYIEHGKEDYARELVEFAGLTPERAQQKTDKDWGFLLPNGKIPAGHYIHAVENEEATVGDAGIAAAILGRDDVVAGAIGVVGAADRLLAAGTRDDLVRAVVAAARAISRDIGAGRGGVALSAL